MNKFVYHGSINGEIKEFIPKESAQKGKYVYATESFEIAVIFAFRMGSLERTLSYDKDGNIVVCERVKDYMKNNDCPVFIYKLDSKPFEYFQEDNWGNHEVRTSQPVKPKEVVKFDSAVEMLKEFAKEGKIKLYFYPDKPEFLPDNDYDLIQSAACLYAMNKNNLNYAQELLDYYPNFENALKTVIKNIDCLPEQEKRVYAQSIYNNKTQKLLPELEVLIDEEENNR